ncbi:phosphate ABC transporter permease [Anopheles sinensis]|uniref:Phosphate ABC transporter permease n=1 Tax=Anopheles sinensis TaxID=74873 RepID=A0A084W8Z4_ANOSI|nr:phosphate ABC transporter permease [Anopheles sinensis]
MATTIISHNISVSLLAPRGHRATKKLMPLDAFKKTDQVHARRPRRFAVEVNESRKSRFITVVVRYFGFADIAERKFNNHDDDGFRYSRFKG